MIYVYCFIEFYLKAKNAPFKISYLLEIVWGLPSTPIRIKMYSAVLFEGCKSMALDFLLVEFALNILSLTEWILPELISHYISRMCCVYTIKPWNPLINVASISQTTIGLSHKTTCSLLLSYPWHRQPTKCVFPHSKLRYDALLRFESDGFRYACAYVLAFTSICEYLYKFIVLNDENGHSNKINQ